MKNFVSVSNTFDPKYHGEQSENIFKSQFKKVNNEGYDIDLDCIIIFDGGDVDGYEKSLEDHI